MADRTRCGRKSRNQFKIWIVLWSLWTVGQKNQSLSPLKIFFSSFVELGDRVRWSLHFQSWMFFSLAWHGVFFILFFPSFFYFFFQCWCKSLKVGPPSFSYFASTHPVTILHLVLREWKNGQVLHKTVLSLLQCKIASVSISKQFTYMT